MRWHQAHRKLLVVLFFILLTLTVGSTFAVAACHVVKPSGSGDGSGSDWNNTLSWLTASFVRGDTYYLAAGTYHGKRFNVAESGNLFITIKKAIESDHCVAPGWQTSFGTGQAVFINGGEPFAGVFSWIDQGHWILDGNGRTGLKSGHGFKVDNSNFSTLNGSTRNPLAIQNSPGQVWGNVTIRYVEVQGTGTGSNNGEGSANNVSSLTCNSAGTQATVVLNSALNHIPYVNQIIVVSGAGDNFNSSQTTITSVTDASHFAYSVSCTPNATSNTGTILGGPINFAEELIRISPSNSSDLSNVTIEYCYFHDTSNLFIDAAGGSNITIQYSLFARNNSSSTFHGIGIEDQVTTNLAVRYNVFEDIEGTAFVSSLGAGNTTTNYQIYGNVLMRHQNNPYNRIGLGNGAIAAYNTKTLSGFLVYNNTLINLPASFASVYVGNEVTATNVQERNNLWYNDSPSSFGPNTGAFANADFNSFINTTFNAAEASVQTTPITNPFVNWPGTCSGTPVVCTGEDYHLVAPTNAGVTLAAPYNTDPDGITRGADGVWDRGAFEFVSGGPTIVSLTLNLTSVTGGNSSTGTVTISSAAPSGGSVVTLSSNNPLIAAGPATVTVPQGGTTATFTVTTTAVSSTTLVTITATLGGTATAILTVNPQGQSAVINGTTKVGGSVVIQ